MSSEPPLTLPGKIALLFLVWATAAQVRLSLSRHTLPEAVAALGTPSQRRRRPVALLSRAVSRGLRVGSWHPRCLIRSLVLYRLLRAQGDPAELIIALPHQATSHDAHAWVELRGRDVGPLPGGSGYVELTRYPRRAAQPPVP